MTEATPHDSAVTPPSLPWPSRRLRVNDRLSIVVYDTGEATAGSFTEPPLLMVHSVNATASAFEMGPLLTRQSAHRRVVAVDLPGFGASDKPDLRYTPALMRDALAAALDAMGPGPVDLLALSLACEFAAELALQRPARIRSLALVSPTGMEGRRVGERHAGGKTREIRFLHSLLRDTRLGAPLYRLLTTHASMNWFLSRSWGSRHFDQSLLQHGRACARLAGAHHAPLDFVAGALFTQGIIARYRLLPLPVWVCHGTLGSFTDFDACPRSTGTAAGGGTFPLARTVMRTGAMPHFEQPDAFEAEYCRFTDQLSRAGWAPPPAAASRQDSAPKQAEMQFGIH